MPTRNLIVVDTPRNWHFNGLHAEVVSTRNYLSSDFPEIPGSVRVFNLSHSYRYQSLGYYVSLLAEARGHVPRPGVDTIRDVRMLMVARSFAEDIDERIQTSLASIAEDKIRLRVFCGRTEPPALAKLARDLYRLFPVPMLEVRFSRGERWRLDGIRPLNLSHLDASEKTRLEEALRAVLSRRESGGRPGRRYLYDMAMVVDPTETHPPSDPEALHRFTEAAKDTGFFVETIQTADIGRINEFDAVFIRQTTAVDQPIYRLSRMAHAEGLVVIDDPWSILRSANKIYLAESLERAGLPAPGAWVLTRKDLSADALRHIPHPCVLKIPDGSFSRGVRKSSDIDETLGILEDMLKTSDLILAQEFLPSEYDWRIGVLDHKPLYACKYFMARGHWQIYNWAAGSDDREGTAETVPLHRVPPAVLKTAVRAARLMGDGLYGVDLKQIGDRVLVIEVNDNPNLDSDVEDAVDGKDLYLKLARCFRDRIETARKA